MIGGESPNVPHGADIPAFNTLNCTDIYSELSVDMWVYGDSMFCLAHQNYSVDTCQVYTHISTAMNVSTLTFLKAQVHRIQNIYIH